MISIFKKAIAKWSKDNCSQLGAGLSYYAVFSLAPLVLLSISLASFTFGKFGLQKEIEFQFQTLLGHYGADALQMLINNAARPARNFISTCLGLITLLIGASGVMGELKYAMDKIWQVEDTSSGIWAFIKNKLLSMLMVLGAGFLLLISLLVSVGLSGMGKFMNSLLPLPEFLMQLLNLGISFVVITGVFATLYKMIPSTRIAWDDVWSGAAVASVLFAIGKFLIGLYLGKAGIGSAYGVAGSFIILLIWIYYSAQIFYFGAEFTKITSERNKKDLK